MITKELLSEVLGRSVVGDIESPFPEYIYYDWDFKDNTMRINIYELAHKCKEWAFKEGYCLHTVYTPKDTTVTIKEAVNIFHNYETIYADTEPDSIFMACQWILENKDK